MLSDILTHIPEDLPLLMTRFALALALGVLVGSERERSTKDKTAPGVRTFTVLSMLGAAATIFGATVVAAAVLTAAVVVVSPLMKNRRKKDPRPGYGATTIAAAVVMPLIGALSVLIPGLAAAMGVGLVVTLASKERVHEFVRKTITPTELSDALKFFVIALIVLPLLPDQAFGPYNAINLHKIGFLVTALTGIGWLGYLAVRVFGASKGLPLAGLAGGFVSSTATTAAMARRATEPTLRRPAVAAALLSKISSLVTLAVLIAAIDIEVLKLVIIPMGAMVLVLLAAAWYFSKTSKQDDREPVPHTLIDAGRPFALKPALILAGIITGALLASKAAASWFGEAAVAPVAALAGTVDTQAAGLAAAELAHQGLASPTIAMLGIVSALVTNTILKVILTYVTAGRKIGSLMFKGLVPATLAMAGTAAALAVFVH